MQEFNKLIDGYTRRKEEKEKMLAYFTSWIIAPHVTNPITTEDILKPLRGTDEKETAKATAEERDKFFKEFGVKGGNSDEHSI